MPASVTHRVHMPQPKQRNTYRPLGDHRTQVTDARWFCRMHSGPVGTSLSPCAVAAEMGQMRTLPSAPAGPTRRP